MADMVDLAQQYELEERERFVSRARSPLPACSRLFCESCDASIPQARRLAVPGVTLCVTCQELSERKAKHYRQG